MLKFFTRRPEVVEPNLLNLRNAKRVAALFKLLAIRIDRLLDIAASQDRAGGEKEFLKLIDVDFGYLAGPTQDFLVKIGCGRRGQVEGV